MRIAICDDEQLFNEQLLGMIHTWAETRETSDVRVYTYTSAEDLLEDWENGKTFDALLGYKSAMAQARVMQEKGLITAEEFAIIETKMCELFGINFDSLFRENDWIISEFRGNMSPTKGVT